ncbi:MAG: hypothetical protein LUG21_06580, partial [Clostridiales bacterium]|nr:hypothetical protein [Clostridiales bacterium]
MKKSLKIFLKILSVVLIFVLILILTAGIYYGASRSCSLNIKIDQDNPLRKFSGWGTSDCWWADNISDDETRNQMADLLFSEQGLNLDTYRYCLYGGYDSENNAVSNKWRLGESFYYFNNETGRYEYDWSRDYYSQAMLKAALDRGVDTVILFANSPHYSMCKNGRPSGADNGECNIDASRYQDYVDYFLTITEHFIDEGIPVKYISPINEPQWNWGGDSPVQEGCHYETDEAVSLLKLFAKSIKERGLSVKLYSLESGNIGDTAKSYYNSMTADGEISETLGVYSFHSYFNDSDKIKKIRFGNWISENVEYRADMSEWCELPAVHSTNDVQSALIMARVISNDISCLNVDSWSNWVAVNQIGISEEDGLDYSDGLLCADDSNPSDYYVAYRYYAYMQYSRFVPAGSEALDCSDGVFTASFMKDDNKLCLNESVNETAFKTPNGDIVLIVVNEGKTRNIKIDLDGFENVSVFTTDALNKCENTYSGELVNKYQISENSINTY